MKGSFLYFQVTKSLLSLGASLDLRCRWTNMSALHYAAYFDVSPVLTELLMKSKGVDVDTPCHEYENGTALHIAAANLSLGAAKVLLRFGADRGLKDDLARLPLDCVPEEDDFSLIPEAGELIEKMEKLLETPLEKLNSVDDDDGDGDDEDEKPATSARLTAARSTSSLRKGLGSSKYERRLSILNGKNNGF